MSTAPAISRRTLIKTTLQTSAAALMIGFDVPQRAKGAQGQAEKPIANPLNAWIKIDQDGSVTLTYTKSEMGQGVSTALPMILAEELAVDWQKVRVEHGPVDPVYGSQGTGGSGSVTTMWTPLRTAGAAARQMLITAAAQKWNVARETCTAKNGAVWHGNDKLNYGELVEAASQLPIPDFKTVALKRPEEFELIGKPLARTDIPAKTDGSAIFGLDVRVPGMVYAVVARCPVFGGKVKTFEATKAKAVKGVVDIFEIEPVGQGVHSCGGVAVVAETTYAAMRARKLLQIDWDFGPAVAESSETLRRQFRRLVDSSMKVIINQADAEAAISGAPADQKIECDYELPFQAHATMEPMNCTVHVESDRAEAWAPTQSPDQVQMVIGNLTKLPPEKIQVHTTFMGGGFGRRYQADFPTEATQIAKRVSKPVQLVWSREDDMTHDFYRPASYHRMSGAVGEGKVTAWRHKYTSTSIAEWFNPKAAPESSELGCTLQMPYLADSYKLEYLPAASAVPRAWWRSVEASVIGFVMESFIDELAHSAGMDPYEFRIKMLGEEHRFVKDALEDRGRPLDTARFKGVLQLVAEKGNWGKALPKGQGRGIAAHYSFHSYVANLVEVEVNKGKLRVNRVVSAVDIGTPVNPDGIRAQVESAIVYGLTAALKSQITIDKGQAVQTNFNTFTTLSMKETPLIEVHIVPSTIAPTGIGEPGLPPTAPALTNAIFAATGKRIRRLPIQPVDLV